LLYVSGFDFAAQFLIEIFDYFGREARFDEELFGREPPL
jgi:hypothetical protein